MEQLKEEPNYFTHDKIVAQIVIKNDKPEPLLIRHPDGREELTTFDIPGIQDFSRFIEELEKIEVIKRVKSELEARQRLVYSVIYSDKINALLLTICISKPDGTIETRFLASGHEGRVNDKLFNQRVVDIRGQG